MEQNRFYILASKKLTGELSAVESIELESYFNADDEYLEIYKKIAAQLNNCTQPGIEDKQKVLANLRTKLSAAGVLYEEDDNEMPVEKRSFWKNYRHRFILSSLVVFLLIPAVTFFVLKNKNTLAKTNDFSENNISTKAGSKSQVKLPDGTLVILNADSKLTYPDNFLGDTREVHLEGEAFFKVVENKKKPFIIHLRAMDIKVLGTVFNVKAYPEEKVSEATLIKGSIEVTLTHHNNEKIMLKPSEKITVSNNAETEQDNIPKNTASKALIEQKETEPLIAVDQLSVDKKENIFKEIGWTENKLMFKNESLETIVNTMERWYGRTIVIQSNRLKEQKFTGNFTEESCMQVIQALQLSYNFSYKKENNSIIIY